VGVSSATPYDKVGIRFGDSSDTILKDVTTVWFWDKSDFRNGADTAPVSFGAGSELNLPELFDVFPGGMRWLVRSGSQYYVSQTAIGNNLLAAQLNSDEIAAELWAEYNPVPGTYDINFDATTAVFSTPSSALTDITAVGMIWDQNSFSTGRKWISWETFRAVATVNTPVNRGPLVEAGPGGSTQPGVGIGLAGSASDEGLPAVPGSVSVAWSIFSGPGTGAFSSPASVITDFTPDAAGTYVLRLTADDGSIATFDEVTLTATTGDPFVTWIDGYPAIPVEQRGLLDDWIRDGILHIFKFAFGLDPTTPHGQDSLYQFSTTGGRVSLTVDMANQQASVLYQVEVADSLDGPWTVIAEAIGGGAMEPKEGVEPAPQIDTDGTSVTVSDIVEIVNSNDSRRFARLKVTYPSP
jgi:hypothetical protein